MSKVFRFCLLILPVLVALPIFRAENSVHLYSFGAIVMTFLSTSLLIRGKSEFYREDTNNIINAFRKSISEDELCGLLLIQGSALYQSIAIML